HNNAQRGGIDSESECIESGNGRQDHHQQEAERAGHARAAARHDLLEFVLAALQQLLEVGPLVVVPALAAVATVIPRHETAFLRLAQGSISSRARDGFSWLYR